MKIDQIELHRLELPLVTPFRTSFGEAKVRDALLVRVTAGEHEGWGECVAMHLPMYSAEYTDAAQHVIENIMVPALIEAGEVTAHEVASRLGWIRGHRMAKAAVECAVLDVELRARDESLAHFLGGSRDKVPAGVSVGISPSVEALLEEVERYVEHGYRRIKLKIKPGWDVAPVRAVRERFGPDLPLQVDANAAYSLADAPHLARLDDFDLLLLEQPLAEDDLVQHAALARRLRTPICLDESITSAPIAAAAIALGACQVVNIKPGRVGGYLESRRIHDLCQAAGMAVWCGGMMETGVGRAANIALASLPNFTLPGDTSASERYYDVDITAPVELHDGCVAVPRGPGIGVDVDWDVIADLRTDFCAIR